MKHTVACMLIVTSFALNALSASASDLAYYLPPENTQWVEPEGDDVSPFLLLTQASEYAVGSGIVLFISEWGLNPLQSPFIRALHKQLPHYGWQSIAFSPPNIDMHMINWRHLGETAYPSESLNDQLPLLKSPLQQRVTQAFGHLAAEPGLRIIVAEGMSAGLLIQLLQINAIPHPDALVVVSPYLPQWQLNNALPTQLAALPFPVLDLQTIDGNSWSTSTAEARVMQARRAHHTGYRQHTLPRTPVLEVVLPKQVYGWLKHEGFQG